MADKSNGRFYENDMSETTTDETERNSTELHETTGADVQGDAWSPTRRQMMIATGATLTLAGSAGLASADEDGLAYSTDYAADPAIAADAVTIAEHRPSMEILQYRDDEGNVQDLPAILDEPDDDEIDDDATAQNLLTISGDAIDADEFRRFPRALDDESDDDEDETRSAIDADEWTGDGLDVESGDLDIDSVRISGTDGSASFDPGETLVDDDLSRRYLQVGVTIDALEAGSTVDIEVCDDAGDAKGVTIDSDGDESDDDVLATSITSGVIGQVQLGDLSGSIHNIEGVEVTIDGDATIELFAFNAERMSRWEFGTRFEDADDESASTVRELSGETTLFDLGGLSADATIYDLEYPVLYTASASEQDSEWDSEPADRYPNFDERLTQIERLKVPTGYDLSHSGLSLVFDQTLPTDRYHAIDLAEDTEDDDPEDMEFSSREGRLEGPGEQAELEEYVQSGLEYAVRFRTVLTDSEFDSATDPAAAGGGARGTSGGWFSGPRAWISVLVSGVLGAVGLSRLTGGDNE